jgi:hypothetical protein
VGEISRPPTPVNSLLDRQTVSKTVDGSVTSLSGEVTNDDERKKIPCQCQYLLLITVNSAWSGHAAGRKGKETLQTVVQYQGYRSVLQNGETGVSLLLNVHNRHGVHPASFPGANDRGVKLTTHLHPADEVKNE